MPLFFDNFKRTILKKDRVRNSLCFLRAIYFCKIKKSIKDYNEISEHTWKNTLPSNKRVVFNEKINLPKHPSAKRIFNVGKSLSGSKAKWLINAITSKHDYQKFKQIKILSIGPRSEGEIFLLYAYGFEMENISAIDLFSYSPLIELGDMHKLNFENESFDIVILGWCLAYSNNKKKVISEVRRVLKEKGSIIIGHTFLKKTDEEIIKERGYLVGSPYSKIKDKEDLQKLLSNEKFEEFYSKKINSSVNSRIVYGATKRY